MSFAKVFSAQTVYLRASIITVEIDISRGLHSFSIVGLPNKAVEEAKDRVTAAIKNSGFESPKSKNHKIIVSLAPANIPKEGATLDVAITLAYLLALGEIVFTPEKKLFLGELALDGTIRPVSGILALIQEGLKQGFTDFFVPTQNAREAALLHEAIIYPITHLSEIIAHLNEKRKQQRIFIVPQEKTKIQEHTQPTHIDFYDIKGQESAKRGLEIAASGAHTIALYGPPGTGKTMLAKAFTTLLPPLQFEKILETTLIHSVAGTLKTEYITHPPFRSPHHRASPSAIIGGGSIPRPGEITLAHNGVLFMDEFPEFDSHVLEALREPLEDRVVHINRAKGSIHFPAHFILIAAMNPCPCGNTQGKCVCTLQSKERYRRKISGPIIDRIDLWLEVGAIEYTTLATTTSGESSSHIADRVKKARAIQKNRFSKLQLAIETNGELTARHIHTHVSLNTSVQEILATAVKNMGLSARAYHRSIKVARTIADLNNHQFIEAADMLEALQYRPKKDFL